MDNITLQEIENAAEIVYRFMPPTPQYAWPLLELETGVRIWVKHENHTPIGAFKIRGGLTYFDRLRRDVPKGQVVVSATRGNHGQSLALAAAANGFEARIYVPFGNSSEKNAAMRAQGASLVEFGKDFEEARKEAERVAGEEGLVMVPSFHRDLVRGVSTYALELFAELKDLDTVYVPIGLGSGICGVMAVRDVLDLGTKVVGVVAENAPAYSHSIERGRLVHTNSAQTFADGVAVRVPDSVAFERIAAGADRIVKVSESRMANAVRLLFRTTHNIAEGAGAAALAAAIKERHRMQGKKVAVILSGGNIDSDWYARIMRGGIPALD